MTTEDYIAKIHKAQNLALRTWFVLVIFGAFYIILFVPSFALPQTITLKFIDIIPALECSLAWAREQPISPSLNIRSHQLVNLHSFVLLYAGLMGTTSLFLWGYALSKIKPLLRVSSYSTPQNYRRLLVTAVIGFCVFVLLPPYLVVDMHRCDFLLEPADFSLKTQFLIYHATLWCSILFAACLFYIVTSILYDRTKIRIIRGLNC